MTEQKEIAVPITLRDFTGYLVQDVSAYIVDDRTEYAGWGFEPKRTVKVLHEYGTRATIVGFLKCDGEYVHAFSPYSDTPWREIAPVVEVALRHGVKVT